MNDDDEGDIAQGDAVGLIAIIVAAVLIVLFVIGCAIAVGDNSRATVTTSAPIDVDAKATREEEKKRRPE